MQRYSNLDTPSKTLQKLHSAGLISPDGRPVHRSDRSTEPVQTFKLDQRLTDAIRAKIIAHYHSGEPAAAIATLYGMSKNSVIKVLREANVPIRRQGLTDEQIDEATRLYEAGKSLTKIGLQLGVDHGTIWRQLKTRGVRIRHTHGRQK